MIMSEVGQLVEDFDSMVEYLNQAFIQFVSPIEHININIIVLGTQSERRV